MFPLLGSLISGGASLLGGMFSSNTSASNTQAQIAASDRQQQNANEFTERMSNTAYQRSSADMRAAGLNPIAMFSSGSGSPSSTPSASGIQAPMPQNTHPLANIGESVKTGIATAVAQKEMDLLASKTANVDLLNKDLKRAVEYLAGGPQTTDTEESRQRQRIKSREDIEGSMYRNLPDWAKTGMFGLRLGSEVSAKSSGIVDDWLGLIPGYKQAKSLGGPSSAKSMERSPTAPFTPSQRQAVKDIMDDRGAASSDARPSKKMIDDFLRNYGNLGGRNKGQGGSYD